MKYLFVAQVLLLTFACKSQKKATFGSETTNVNNTYRKGIIQKAQACKYPLIQSVAEGGDTLILIAVSGLSGKEKDGSQIIFEYQPLRMPQPEGCKGIPASISLK